MFTMKKAVLAASALAAIATATLPASAVAGRGEAAPAATQQLRIGAPAGGALAAGDDRLSSGEFVDRYRFSGRRGERVAIDLGSTDFDAYLILRGPDGRQIDNDDRDARQGTDSRIETALAADGEYEVSVTSYRPGETGRYSLALAPSAGTPRQAQVRSGPNVYALIVGVSDYGGRANDLSNTDADAKALALQLEHAGALNPASIVLTN